MEFQYGNSEITNIPLFFLYIGGIHPKIKSPLGKVYFFVINLAIVFIGILGLWEALKYFNSNLDMAMEPSQTFVIMIQALGEGCALYFRRSNLEELLVISKQFWQLDGFPPGIRDSCAKILKVGTTVCKLFFIGNGFSCVFLNSVALIGGGLPFPCYIPNGWQHWQLTLHLMELVITVALITNIVAADVFFCAMCTEIIVQFKLLAFRFREFTAAKYKENNHDVYKEFKNLVDYHNFLLMYCKKCNKLSMELLFIQFVLTISSSPVHLFMTTKGNLTFINQFKCLCFFTAEIIELGIYCFCAEYVSASTAEVAEAIWESDWEVVDCQRLWSGLPMVTRRAQKPFAFICYGCFRFNLTLFANVCKTVMSFYTYLKTVQDDLVSLTEGTK